MNTNLIEGDSLLSNISNISVKIDHNRSDGSGFFNNFLRQHQNNQQQIPIDQIEDHDDFNHGSLVNRFLLKNKEDTHPQQSENTWVTGNKAEGLSQEEDSSQPISQNNEQSQHQQEQVQMQNKIIHGDNQQEKEKLLLEKRLKNQTKNIPKNYGKAIISFIEKYQEKVKFITQKCGVQYEDFIEELKQRKKTINTIADLRNMWIDYKYARCLRLLSNLFLRRYALNYIFNSRICNYGSHIKYRYRLCEAIKQPNAFKHIKDY